MLYSIVGILVIIIDQAVKFWVSNTLFGTDIVKFIPGVISLVNVHNTGAAFGFLSGRIYFIVVTGVIVLLVVIALATNFISGKVSRWSLVLVAAGALGNMIDRIIYGYVQDMFKVELFNFAIFNVADIFITVFAIVFALAMIFERPEEDIEELYEDDEDEEEEEEQKPRRKTKAEKKAKADADEEDEEASASKPSNVRSARKARQEKYEKEYEEYKAQQRAAMRKDAGAVSAAATVEEDDADPFAAWEQANARVEASQDNSYAGRVMDRPAKADAAPAKVREKDVKPVRETVKPEPKQEPKPTPKPEPKPVPKPVEAPKAPAASVVESAAEDVFSLDDILAEFK